MPHWCHNEDCLLSVECFDTVETLNSHIDEHHDSDFETQSSEQGSPLVEEAAVTIQKYARRMIIASHYLLESNVDPYIDVGFGATPQ
jgi:hypothetical protein